jgi:hypothetical protein
VLLNLLSLAIDFYLYIFHLLGLFSTIFSLLRKIIM